MKLFSFYAQSKVKDADGVAIGVVCPCCTRPMNNEETASFLESMDVLIDPERSDILRRIRARTRESAIIRDNLERWRGTVLKCMSDWNTCRRLNNECNEVRLILFSSVVSALTKDQLV